MWNAFKYIVFIWFVLLKVIVSLKYMFLKNCFYICTCNLYFNFIFIKFQKDDPGFMHKYAKMIQIEPFSIFLIFVSHSNSLKSLYSKLNTSSNLIFHPKLKNTQSSKEISSAQ